MFPIRCLIEAVEDDRCPQCSEISGSVVISDSYAIVAGQTPLNQLVDTVLAALGLQHLACGCKAMLQLKNWKPLTFDQITDDSTVDIESILKDVSNQLTLRILTKQPSVALQGTMTDLKDRLLRAVLQKVPSLLTEAQLTHWKDFLSQLAFSTSASSASLAQTCSLDALVAKQANNWLDEWSKKIIQHQSVSACALDSYSDHAAFGGPSQHSNSTEHGRPSLSQQAGQENGADAPPTITRFSPLLEVPKLERWFRENSNPSRHRLQQFVNVLNASNFRKHTSKITYQQICNWFINARATSRKRAIRMSHAKSEQNANTTTGSSQASNALSGNANSVNGGPPWPLSSSGKVFTNQIRSLSLAFNNFIKSSTSPTGSSEATPAVGQTFNNNNNNNNNNAFKLPSSADVSATADVENGGDDDAAINLTKNLHNDDSSVAIDRHQQKSLTASDPTSPADQQRVEKSPEDRYSKINDRHLLFKSGSSAEIDVNQVKREESTGSSSSPLASAETLVHLSNANAGSEEYTISPVSCNDGESVLLPRDGKNFLWMESTPNHVGNSSQGVSSFQQQQQQQQQQQVNRSRLMFDPLSELPMLEKWFEENPHPSWVQIDQITETLNALPYRQTYPRVSSHNVKIWFKNRRAKCKRHLMASESMIVNDLI